MNFHSIFTSHNDENVSVNIKANGKTIFLPHFYKFTAFGRKWSCWHKKSVFFFTKRPPPEIFEKLTTVRINEERDLIFDSLRKWTKKECLSLVSVVCFVYVNVSNELNSWCFTSSKCVFTLATVNHSSYNATLYPFLLHRIFFTCAIDTVCLSFNPLLLLSFRLNQERFVAIDRVETFLMSREAKSNGFKFGHASLSHTRTQSKHSMKASSDNYTFKFNSFELLPSIVLVNLETGVLYPN